MERKLHKADTNRDQNLRFYEQPEVREVAGLIGEIVKEAVIICITASLAALSTHYTGKYLEGKSLPLAKKKSK